jgi:hypothetical protein
MNQVIYRIYYVFWGVPLRVCRSAVNYVMLTTEVLVTFQEYVIHKRAGHLPPLQNFKIDYLNQYPLIELDNSIFT